MGKSFQLHSRLMGPYRKHFASLMGESDISSLNVFILCCVFTQFEDQDNTGLVKKVRESPLFLYFLAQFEKERCQFFFEHLLKFTCEATWPRLLCVSVAFAYYFNFTSCYQSKVNPKNFTKKLLDQISELGKVAGYKVSIQKLIAFCTSKMNYQKEKPRKKSHLLQQQKIIKK